MSTKGIYAGRPASFQGFVLILLILTGSVMGGILSLFIPGGGPAPGASFLRGAQLISSICMFLLPALAAGYLFSHNIREYLSIRDLPDGKILAVVVLSMLLLMPVIGITALFNQQMELPAFLEPVERWMKEQENLMERVTKLLLTGQGIGILAANILVIAVMAGITEEFLFRGAVQRILEKKITNHHTVIWTAAFLFSAFHLQFYGLIPRMLLGAYFGYLLYWSRNIWIPVIAHFFNNLWSVLIMSNPDLSENKYLSDSASPTDILPAAVVGLVLFIICAIKLRKMLRLKILLS